MTPLISIIIPHKNSLDTLPRLLKSIPVSDKIEIIVVDNSAIPISKTDIESDIPFALYHCDQNRYAGGARNVGIEHSHGKWLIFADADDFFTSNAFDAFLDHVDDTADMLYFKSDSVYDETLEPSDRHIIFNKLIDGFVGGKIDETQAKIDFLVPWAKMIRRSFLTENNILFDEVIAANDVFFSTLAGYYCNNFKVDNRVVYVVTSRKGSLANRQDLTVLKTRYSVALRRNEFLKEHGLHKYQGPVMYYIYMSLKQGIKPFMTFLKLAISYRQNIFIGFTNWPKTFIEKTIYYRKNKSLIVR